MLFLLNKFEEKYYPELKQFCNSKADIPSQMVRKNNLIKAKNLTKASKIILQMNAKVGNPLWKINSKVPIVKNKNIMYGAISGSKG